MVFFFFFCKIVYVTREKVGIGGDYSITLGRGIIRIIQIIELI